MTSLLCFGKISNKKVLKFSRTGFSKYNSFNDQIFKKPAVIVVLETLGKGSSTVKIKQTYKGKTKVVATYNVVVKARTADDGYYWLNNACCAQREKKTEYVNEEGVTVLMITHDPDIAAHAKRVVTIRDGILQEKEVPGHA